MSKPLALKREELFLLWPEPPKLAKYEFEFVDGLPTAESVKIKKFSDRSVIGTVWLDDQTDGVPAELVAPAIRFIHATAKAMDKPWARKLERFKVARKKCHALTDKANKSARDFEDLEEAEEEYELAFEALPDGAQEYLLAIIPDMSREDGDEPIVARGAA